MIGHVCSHGHVTGRSHLITCVLTITCASDEQVRHSIPSLGSLCLQRTIVRRLGCVGVSEVEFLDKFGCVFHSGGGYPRIFGVWISNPFDQVLDASSVRGRSCIEYSFHFIVVLFAFDYVRRWLGHVGTVFLCFFIGSKKEVMGHGVGAASRWVLQTSVGGGHREDLERAMSFRGKFGLGMGGLDVGTFEPNELARGERL